MNELMRWSWVFDHVDDIWVQTLEHLSLTGIAVGLGCLISLPLALLVHRNRRYYGPVTSFTGILYTIPSLALFAMLVPYTGLSLLTAEIGLVSYTLLIIIRNVVAGLAGVPEEVKEAARGMGYTKRQMLWRVEVPLATPVILAGLRIATVTTIGLVTVTSLIGYGGLGFFIKLGLDRAFNTATLLGAVLSMALAVIADRSLVWAERRLTPWLATSPTKVAA